MQQQRNRIPQQVGRRFGVTAATVIEWCDSGLMSAVDVSSPQSTRRRWRMSQEDIEAFEAKRGSRQQVSQ